MGQHVKILFEYGNADSGAKEIESVWAVPTETGYQIDNIPFYAAEIALGDIVSAMVDDGGMLRFQALIAPSGHSTVRLWFAKGKDNEVSRVRTELRARGCSSELSDMPRLVAVDVPPTVPYSEVRRYLDENEAEGVFEYEEACLGGQL